MSGASDKKVRVFSRAKERIAAPEAVQTFEDSVKSSSIPKQQLGDVQKENLPGPEFLQQKSGTKEGQVAMIREGNGSVTAHQWSQGAQKWVNVGTVVDAVGSSGRKTDFGGKEYDYVFDVDIEDGKPPLKLPYNLSENPYETATKFIQDNELPMTYLDQVANFITANTQGATLGQSSQGPAGSDPLGTESRYRPGDSMPPPTSALTALARPRVLPQTSYLSIKTATLRTIRNKIGELNQQLINEGSQDLALSPTQLEFLSVLMKPLEDALANIPASQDIFTPGIDLVMQMISTWPAGQQIPALDLLRLLTAATPKTAAWRSPAGATFVDVLEESKVFADPDRPNNIMLAVRALSNLFEQEPGIAIADASFSKIHTLIKASSSGNSLSNRNLSIAIATLHLNYAVLFTSEPYRYLPSYIDRGLVLIDDLTGLVKGGAVDSEAIYRVLVALGTLLVRLDEDVGEAMRNVFDVDGVLRRAEQVAKEPRVKGIVGEIRGVLFELN